MSDGLVNRLRWAATLGDLTTTSARNLMEEAADRIAELEAALKNSADALREAGCNFAWAVANAALKGGKQDENDNH